MATIERTLIGFVPSNAIMHKGFDLKDFDGKVIGRAVALKRWEVAPRADGSRYSYQLRAVDNDGCVYTGRTTGPGGDFRGRPVRNLMEGCMVTAELSEGQARVV